MPRRIVPVLVLLAAASCRSDSSPGGGGDDVEARIARIETHLPPPYTIRGEPVAYATIGQRLAELNVPGVSIAVLNEGRIEWARGYGWADAETHRPVTENTRFQAASISKPIAALAALRLVESGRITLDGDVNQWLTSWRVPENEFTTTAKVTLRRLLTHTAGLTIHGFPGYGPGAQVPSTVGVLEGRGNTDPVVPFVVPGTRQIYSGGGYTIVQLLVSDVNGRPFADVMREQVLEPIGMTRSTYAQPIPADMQDDMAIGYRPDGSRVDGNWHTYPEQAAAGLWTTPSDLARYAMEVQRAAHGESDAVISQAMAREMLSEQASGQGLGPGLDPTGPAFRHGGSNEGYRSGFHAYVDGGRGGIRMAVPRVRGEGGHPARFGTAPAMDRPVPAARCRRHGRNRRRARYASRAPAGPHGLYAGPAIGLLVLHEGGRIRRGVRQPR